MGVNRCICRDVTFRALLDRAAALGLRTDLGQDEFEVFARLQDDTGLGTGCGACVPYARVALKTGRCSLPVMSPAEFERLLSSRGPGVAGPGPGGATRSSRR